MSIMTLNEIIVELTDLLSKYTKIEKSEIDIDEDLTEIGVDSIIFTQIKKDILTIFGVDIAFTKIYKELNTLYKISEYISNNSENYEEVYLNEEEIINNGSENIYKNTVLTNNDYLELISLFNCQLQIIQQQNNIISTIFSSKDSLDSLDNNKEDLFKSASKEIQEALDEIAVVIDNSKIRAEDKDLKDMFNSQTKLIDEHKGMISVKLNQLFNEGDIWNKSIILNENETQAKTERLGDNILSVSYSKNEEIENEVKNIEYSLTKEQLNFLTQWELTGGSSAFNEAIAIKVLGNLDIKLLEESLNKVVKRHEALRTIIDNKNSTQTILNDVQYSLELIEIRDENAKQLIEEIIKQEFLLEDVLFRVKVIKESHEQYILVIVVHHIIADGWSLGVLYNELKEFYNSYFTGKKVDINIPVQFREYVQIKEKLINKNRDSEILAIKSISKTGGYLDLRQKFSISNREKFGGRFEFIEDEIMLKKLRKVSSKNNTSIFNTMLALFIGFLSKVSKNKNITVGIPFAGQNIIGAESLIGNCVEMIGINLEIEDNYSLNNICNKVKDYFKEFEDNSYFNAINSHNNYNVVFNVNRRPVDYNFHETQIEYISTEISESKYDLYVGILEMDNKLNIRFDYSKDIFAEETINRWVKYFKLMLKAVVEENNSPLEEINIVDTEEMELITNKFSTFKCGYIESKLGEELSNYGILNKEESIRVFILDNDMNITGIGIIGDIYIGNNELEIYNTNKLGRILENGELDVLGEEEKQVVIKDRYISLYKIEEKIRNNTRIIDTVCEYDSDNSEIIAYIIEKEKIDNVSEIIEELRKELPALMIPSKFIKVSDLSERINGEVVQYIEKTTKTEDIMINIWKEVLDVQKLSVEDNFFELGGNSIKAMKLLSKVQQNFNKDFSIKKLFENQTIKKLSGELDSIDTSETMYNKIVKLKNSEYYDVSSVQKRMYALHKLDMESLNYNVPFGMIVKGELNIEKLNYTINKIIERHETLRTYFEEIDGKVLMKIVKGYTLNIDCEEKASSEDEINYLNNKIIEFVKPFNLNKLPLLRVKLLKLYEKKYFILIDFHHIIFDGASSVVFAKEFLSIYNENELSELEIQYKDYAAWNNSFCNSKEMLKQEQYWKEIFNDGVPVLNLPIDYNRPLNQTFKGRNISFNISEKISSSIDEFCKIYNITPYIFFLSSINLLLSKYTGQEDIVIGSVVEGRKNLFTSNLIGMFVNTIVMRNKPISTKSFIEFLEDVKNNTLNVFDNSDYQFENLVSLVDGTRDSSRHPLFNVLFVFQNNQIQQLNTEKLEISSYEIKTESSRLDLSFEIRKEITNYKCNIEFNNEIFMIETIERLSIHLQNLMENILKNAKQKLKDIKLLNNSERNQLLFEFNEDVVNYPKNMTIQQLFEEQVNRTPNNIAVVYGDEKLTYSELNARANQLARILRKKGVGPNSIVGIMVERSIEMIVGILGIIKASGGYLPINISYPKERVEYILEDSEVKLLLLKGDMPSNIIYNGETIDLLNETIYTESNLDLENINCPHDMAYIIYTSGTTGKPKGAILEHKNVVRLFFNDKSLFDFNQNDVWTMFHSYCFDFSVWEMYGALFYGGRLVIVPESIAQDSKEFLCLLKKENVTVLNQTPSAFYNLSNEEIKINDKEIVIRYIIFGGEELKPRKLKEWKDKYPDSKLINMYGITETTVHVTYKEITEEDIEKGISNIGKPIPTLSVYIIDNNLDLVPVGVVGELCVSGEGLARGYLNREELTNKKFITNPFMDGKRMYRSGDLARWLPNGELEYLGRIDQQVKIRGHRIEIGEIEATINEHSGVDNSLVTIKKGNMEETSLVAYVIPKTDTESISSMQEINENIEQVEQWEEVFNGVYSKVLEIEDKKFDIVGWDSSYTGKLISENEMAEWLNTTIERILSFKPNSVLEIGCGTGMILYRVAPNCNSYCATDLSARAIDYVGSVINNENTLRDKVTLINTSADDFSRISGQYDFVILNSIVQYFPSVEYLVDVLDKTINTLKSGSIIFMGDIRNYSLLREFHTSTTLFKNTGEVNLLDLRHQIERNIEMDSELVIDPMFFYALKKHFPRITHVDILNKKGKENNELTLFRYDAVLYIETEGQCHQETTYNWQKDSLDLQQVKNILEVEKPERLSLINVPNSRMQRVSIEVDVLLNSSNLRNLNDIVAEVDKRLTNDGVNFEEFRQMASLDYDVEILWAGQCKNEYYNVVFIRKSHGENIVNYAYSNLDYCIEDDYKFSQFTSNPLKAKYLKNFILNLKNHLKSKLPEYMIPAYFLQLEKFPLTPNGKIDKKMLPEPILNRNMSVKYEATRNKIEEKLLSIWRKVLGVDKIGINDNFFELGGHSLNATVVTSEIHKDLSVEVPLKELFKNPTIKELGSYIENCSINVYETIEKCEEKDFYETSSSQKRIYTLQQLNKESIAYNMPAAFELKGNLDVKKIEKAFNKLVERHEALRTYFTMIDGEILQKINDVYDVMLEVKEVYEKDVDTVIKDFIKSFDLSKSPLFRVEVVKCSGKNYLLIDMHHIISDGTSVSILIKEFSMFYNGIELEPLRLQYKDFAQWQNKFLSSENILKEREYWKNTFNNEVPVLNLPYDFERSEDKNYEGDYVGFYLDEETTSKLRNIAKEFECTIHMVLLSVYNILLSKYSEKDCIVVGVPVAGRPHADLHNIIGMFVNTLALKNSPSVEKTFKEFLKEVKENSIKAYENQNYQFEELIEVINIKREKGRNPLFDVMFNMVNSDYVEDIELDSVTLKPYIIESTISKFDLTLIAKETNDIIEMSFDYSSNLFKRSTIERAVKDIMLIFDAILKNTDVKIDNINIRSEEDIQYILEENQYLEDIKEQDFLF